LTSPAQVAQAIYQLPSSAFATPALVNPGQEPGQAAAPDLPDGLPTKGSLILMQSLGELHAAIPDYVQADEMYDGEVGETFASEQVTRLLAKSGINQVEDFNYAKVPVDTIADKLQIRAITASAGDEAEDEDEADEAPPDEDAPKTVSTVGGPKNKPSQTGKKKMSEAAQESIDELRTRNQLEAEEGELHLKASRYGEAYLFVWPVVDAPEDDEDAFEGSIELDQEHQGKVESVDMFVNSPYTTRMFYDAENPLRATHVLKSWEWVDEDNDETRRRATLYFRDRIERWVTKVGGDPDKREDWIPYLEEADVQWPAPNPTKRLPFFHFRNARTYGKPEHLSAYGPQRLINKLVSAHGVTVDYQSFPQRYLLMDPKGDDPLMNLVDPDNPEDDDDDPEGDGRSQLRADPSALWKLWGAQVGQFATADPDVFMTPLDRYIKAISELCGIPLDRFVGYSQPPSGDARRAGNEVLYEKVGARHRTYGSTWGDAYEFALELLGMKDITVTVQWKPPEIATGADDWAVVEKKIALGVPVKQALMEAGYPEDEVEKWLLDQTGADLVRRVALLNSVGTAIQAMAGGVAVGLVSPEQAGDILSRIIGAVGDELPDLDEPVELHPQMQQMQMAMQQTQRGQQITEHQATAPPVEKDSFGNERPQAKRDLPPMPPPPAPVKVGGKKR